jgi:curved DNA-binding protein CbpA
MDNAVDYYQILHVDREAPLAVIRASYRTLMQSMKGHPDLGGDHQTATIINEAYAILSNPEKRQAYDRRGWRDADRRSLTKVDRPGEAKGNTTTSSANRSRHPRSNGYAAQKQLSTASCCAFCRRPHAHGLQVTRDTSCANCSSPLVLKQQQVVSASGSRAIERYPKQQPIQFYVDWPGSARLGRTLDISPNGMLFETTTALQLQQVIKICCALCDATARVAHVKNGANTVAIGVEFVTLRFAQNQGGFVSVDA